MRIIAKRTLKEFWEKHPGARKALESWFAVASDASWEKPGDITNELKGVSVLKNDRVCFNIAGNKYRLIVYIAWEYYTIYIRFIGTHAEYDKIDANNV